MSTPILQTKLYIPPLRDSNSRAAWLSFDEADNDPIRFFAYVIAAMQQVDASLDIAAQGLLQSAQPPASKPHIPPW